MVSIRRNGVVSLAEKKDDDGGIELGVALPLHEMEAFEFQFFSGLQALGHKDLLGGYLEILISGSLRSRHGLLMIIS
ncbi:hypothetical protein J5N97_023537 [Dioscorea zingiberensis]|uniref:Uncharacterized protein n=1 Tax=Dioscorea zingiberensis TaxID=325984 RepID=A0A9D5C515_9LILI|nr:hypothetical protein J5N97_023537 [Dioscorea zingiberensis]